MRILLAVAVLLCGCGCGSSNSSPDAVFKAAKKSAESNDWKTFYGCCDPEKAQDLLAVMVMMAGFSVMQDKEGEKELHEIFRRHGIDPDKQVSMKASDSKAAMASVKDPAACFHDLMTFNAKKSKKGDAMSMMKLEGDLSDVKIEGDKASGTVTLKDGKKTPVSFIHRGGSWYLSDGK